MQAKKYRYTPSGFLRVVCTRQRTQYTAETHTKRERGDLLTYVSAMAPIIPKMAKGWFYYIDGHFLLHNKLLLRYRRGVVVIAAEPPGPGQ